MSRRALRKAPQPPHRAAVEFLAKVEAVQASAAISRVEMDALLFGERNEPEEGEPPEPLLLDELESGAMQANLHELDQYYGNLEGVAEKLGVLQPCALVESGDGELQAITAMVRTAATRLASATTAAQVLEAKDQASVAYDASKLAGRMLRAKKAHDDLISAAYRVQADALEIEAAAKRRLADEYDAAQSRGEVASGRDGPGAGVSAGNAKATAAELASLARRSTRRGSSGTPRKRTPASYTGR